MLDIHDIHDIYYLLRPTPVAAAHAAALWRTMRVHGAHFKSFPMPPERMHVTLLPLGRFEGPVPRDLTDLLRAVGSAVDDEPFDVFFDRVQSHSGGTGRIGTVQLTGPVWALHRLRRFQRDLRERVIRAGIPSEELRTGFNPHMTLDYQHPHVHPLSLDAPVAWPVERLCLVDSLYGQGRHELLASWPLRPRQGLLSWGSPLQ